jgi:long-chain acyl-CoA synthetase
MLVHELLRRTASTRPEQTALIAGEAERSFGEINRDSDFLAAEFHRRGVRRGDRVVAVLENSIDLVVTLWAVLKAGAVFIPLHSAAKAGSLKFILEDSGAKCLVIHRLFHARVEEALNGEDSPGPAPFVIWAGGASPSGDGASLHDILAPAQAGAPAPVFPSPGVIDQDLALIIYTSGSTGAPKGVMLTHHAVCNNARCISRYLGAVESDVVLCVLPLSFGYGLFQVLTGAETGFSVVLERSFAFPYEVLKQISRRRVTGLPGVPTIFAKLLELAPFEGFDLSHIRYLTNAAAALPPAHVERLRRLLPQARLFSMYGQTECTRVCYLDPERIEEKPGSVGRAMPNCEVYIVDGEGRRCAPGEVGELVVRGANVMRGYWRRPEETARALRDGDIPGEKVLYTGDLFRADEDGDLYFVSRQDDIFKCRGEKVSPKEIEHVLFDLEGVAEAAVVGAPHPVDGMAIKAFVVLRAGCGLSEKALRRHCAARLETRLVPRFFEFCETLPKTESGKITKRLLCETAG